MTYIGDRKEVEDGTGGRDRVYIGDWNELVDRREVGGRKEVGNRREFEDGREAEDRIRVGDWKEVCRRNVGDRIQVGGRKYEFFQKAQCEAPAGRDGRVGKPLRPPAVTGMPTLQATAPILPRSTELLSRGRFYERS
jgi:hypothetical protein